jgi:hypothetical protein
LSQVAIEATVSAVLPPPKVLQYSQVAATAIRKVRRVSPLWYLTASILLKVKLSGG